MLIHLKTFDGHTINDWDNYRAYLLSPRSQPNAKPVYIEQTDADSVDAGVYTVDIVTRVVSVEIANYANRYALISQLKAWCKRGTRGILVGTFVDDGVDYQIECRVVNLVQDIDHPTRWTIILQSSASTWRSVSAETDTWNVTSTGGNKTIAVGGDDETQLCASIVSTVAPSSGYVKQNICQLVNVPKISYGLRPWCLTVDTAALVTAGKMLSSCYDLRIFNGDVELKRWIADANTSATKVWINLDIREGYSLKLKTPVASSGVIATLDFVVDKTYKAILASMPTEGILYHGTEWFSYSALDAVNCKATVRERGIFGTTKQSHSANDVFYYIQHPLRMVYNNPSATNPALDDENYDDEKPMFNLSSSSNAQWVYDATTKFYDPDKPKRTGQWTLKENKLGDVSEIYHIKENASSGDPAMGVKGGTYQVGTLYKADTIELAFELFCGGGFYRITATGRKYRNNTKWFASMGFEYSADKAKWTALWAEGTPSTVSTWESWATHSAVSVSSAAKYLRMVAKGVFPLLANAYGMSEALTVTAEYISANLPTASFLGEATNHWMNFALSNAENSDELTLIYPAQYNIPFVMDGENHEAFYGNVNAHKAITLNEESRDAWIRLDPGNNALSIVSIDVGTLALALSWYRRRIG